ncbi:hypothetical protein [Mitsuaria sp. BK037]|uniref:hypothetical protein n=1 Tax=Mitsuaria sp. BK037 TaxID=2587122 RepID=UPI001610FDFC|nr:hypothetical protein [Mitsuaria sp. BK037]MBB3281615.1 hypothetical protein [Mitsuaria sp. BK037]
MTTGTEQRERFPMALEPGYFRPDDLSFEQRVDMMARLAEQLRFIDLDDQEDGDWRGLFATDPTLVMAGIAALDPWPLQQQFGRDADSAPLELLARQVLGLAARLDHWWRALAGIHDDAPRVLRERIQQLVEQQLAADLRWVERRFLRRGDEAAASRPTGPVERDLSRMWHRTIGEEPAADAAAEREDRERLRERFFAFLSAVEEVRRLARELLPDSMATANHEPAAAMLIAFLKVCETAQREVNRLPARHTAFYYRDCLGFGPAPAHADRVHLACQRDPRAPGDLTLPTGTAFEAGKDAAGRPVRFVSEAPIAVTDTRVAALCTLRLERDPLIAPERDLHYVTRAKVARPVADGRTVWPLFGAAGGAGAEDARIGLAVASPLLALREGDREIRVILRQTSSGAAPDLRGLRDAALRAESASAFRDAFGDLLPQWLLADGADSPAASASSASATTGTGVSGIEMDVDDLSEADWTALRHTAHRLTGNGLPALFNGPGRPHRALVFDRLLQGAFRVSLSTPSGWHAVEARLERAAGAGLSLFIRLRADAPPVTGCDPVVHGAEWPTRLPVLRLELATQARLYPYSLLARLPLAEVDLRVKARGVRDVRLANNLGRLDPSKAFAPFGPLPGLSSYLVVGSPEAARKTLDHLSLDLEWGGLPNEPGGFDTHYAGYAGPAGKELRQGQFSVEIAWLRDGQWQDCANRSARQPLFAGTNAASELIATQHIELDPGSVRKLSRATEEDWSTMAMPRNGLCRLQLSGPRAAFGHTAYPIELGATVAANARTRRPRPLPNPPYTPVIERLSLNYEAASVIALDRDDDPPEGVDGERLFHLHPFGLQTLLSAVSGGGHGLLPRLGADGNLYLGLSGSDPGGVLTLLFQLRESSARGPLNGARPRALQWWTLADDDWRPLPPTRVLGDTTHGGLTSGIVTLDLPRDMSTTHTVMPAGLYWLRLSATSDFDGFGGLVSVRTQGLRLRRELPGDAGAPPRATGAPAAPPQPLVDGVITRPTATLAGLASVAQVGRSFGLRAAEDERALITRAGERLQHKGRASLGWDVERLLLSRFPEVLKVRCLPANDGSGGVTAVVLPTLPRNLPALACAAPRFNAIELARMASALREIGSPFARFQVRNPAYDRLQLRATIGLARGAHEGATLRRVNQEIVEFLSPWFDDGYGPRFDWLVRSEDLEARLRGLEGVSFVTRLSLITVACDDHGVYTLADTARAEMVADLPDQPPAIGAAHAHARLPWSIALPMPQHILTAVDRFPQTVAPSATGVDRLAVGSTFVIGGPAAQDASGVPAGPAFVIGRGAP